MLFKRICLLIPILVQLLPMVNLLADSRVSIELFKTGVTHFNKSEYEASIDFFKKAIEEDPKNIKAHYFLGMAYFKSGFEENALIELNTLIDNGTADEITKNLANYISKKRFFFQQSEKSKDYSPGLKIEEGNIGKYIVSKTTGIWIDAQNNIYIASFGSKIALKLSPNGIPLFNFTSPKISSGRLYDIVVSDNGMVYISDFSNDLVYIFTNSGKYLDSFGGSGYQNGKFYGPTSLTLDSDGNIYVIDSGNIRIEKFTPEGKFIMVFGREGDDDGEFYRPSGIAVDRTGNIYVSDHKKKKIFIFDKDGNFISTLLGVQLKNPYGLYITKNNSLLIGDEDRIIKYDLIHSSYRIISDPIKTRRIMDVVADNLGEIYLCSFDKVVLSQLVPKPDKYRNLNILIDNVDASSYPAISYTISVFDADGIPIYGLEDKNFKLKIGGGIVPKIDLSYNKLRNSRNEIMFLVDKSITMQKYAQDLENKIYDIVSNVSSNDEMMVIGYNSKSWIASSFTHSKLRTLDAINEDKYDNGRSFDTAFRRAIDYLNQKFYKKSLIYITDGNLDDSSFSRYSFDSCLSYAANNYIPVYVLNFTDNGEKRLRYLARITGGTYYNIYHSSDLQYLYKRIKNYILPNYYIFFEDQYDPKLKNLFIKAEAEVEINGRYGKGKLGFIYP
ncbi:MAG: hypothetical protein DRP84_02060 [Spirochaetes bacterium]|nr:MAG: hypothetical protein DRP84_02060 [Spirochaetota bacterium]